MSTTLDRVVNAGGRAGAGVALVPLGLSLSIFLAATFVLCAIGGFIPGLKDLHFLSALYPALDWGDPAMIGLGAAYAFACGWYAALVCGGLYNFFLARRA
jgi:hypothetical protein